MERLKPGPLMGEFNGGCKLGSAHSCLEGCSHCFLVILRAGMFLCRKVFCTFLCHVSATAFPICLQKRGLFRFDKLDGIQAGDVKRVELQESFVQSPLKPHANATAFERSNGRRVS